MRKTRIDMTGLRFGRLIGVAFAYRKGSHAHWRFLCDCGAETIVAGAAVRAGKTSSCGCFHRERSAARLTTHGHRAGKRHEATYRAWQEINTYCANPRSPRYRDFGARGIAVCRAWRGDFECFVRDMGERPAGTMLARADSEGDFAPRNCHWTAVHSRSLRATSSHRRG
jgi:hypothetical protein